MLGFSFNLFLDAKKAKNAIFTSNLGCILDVKNENPYNTLILFKIFTWKGGLLGSDPHN